MEGEPRELFLRLPFPVSVNEIIGKKYKPKKWHDLFEVVRQIGACSVDDQPFTGSLQVAYYFQKDDFRIYDIANFVKLTDDSFTAGGVWLDDSQVDDCRQKRLRVGDPGEDWVFIHIREIHPIPFLEADRASRSEAEMKLRTKLGKTFRLANPKPKKKKRVPRKPIVRRQTE